MNPPIGFVDIPGLECFYAASKDGKIFSYKGSNHRGKIIAPYTNKKWNYVYIRFHINKKTKVCLLHRVIAKIFIPNPFGKKEVNHINGDKSDNRSVNLEWVTPSENIKHSYKIGTHKTSKLQIETARRLGMSGVGGMATMKKIYCLDGNKKILFKSARYAHEKMGVSHQNISNCLRGITKTDGGFVWMYD